MATLYDVCKETGFSTATVSRVINDSGLVKEATRERVLAAMEKLNYRPSHAARRLAGSKTDTIGVVLPVIANGFYVNVLHGIDEIATNEKRTLMISFYHSDDELLEILRSLSQEGRADAIILGNTTLLQPTKVRELTGDNFPVVLLGQNHGGVAGMDSVLIDNFRGAADAVESLLQSNPKSLLLLTGPQDNFDSVERLMGARQAIQDHGEGVEIITLNGDFHHEGARDCFNEHINQSGSFPDAVFAFNDDMALGVLDVLEEHGKSAPEDMQVVGYDGLEIARYIGLSSVTVPMRQIGTEAARQVMKRVNDASAPPSTIRLDTELVTRKTST